MSPSLSTADLARLEQATRTVLSPLVFASVDAWRQEVMRSFCALFGASGAAFYLPGQRQMVKTFGSSGHLADRIGAYTEATWSGTGHSADPILDEFHEALVRTGTTVWSMASADHELLGAAGRAWRSLFYNEVLAEARAGDTHAVFIPTARGSLMLGVQDFHRAPVDDEHFPLFRVLQPALVAGAMAIDQFAAHRAALDDLGEPLAAFDADGGEAHRTPALVRLLAADPESARVEVAIASLARRLRPLAFARGTDDPGMPTPTAEVRTMRSTYTLRGVILSQSTFGGTDAFLVSVVAGSGAPALPTVAEVRTRQGLTEREAEVALLVARGLSNDAIAERLFVSRHTVRHHVENAMAKLELTGRGREAVAARLLGADAVGEVA